MRNFLITLILLLSFFVLADNEGPDHILIINSYNTSYKWTQTLMEGIMDNLDNSLDIRVEYLDAKNYTSQEYFDDLYEIFTKKYENISFDAIIATDDYAIRFLIDHDEELFKDVPIFFAGLNNQASYGLAHRTGYYGVSEELSLRETIQTAKQLNPNLDTIHLIVDETITGNTTYENMINLESDYQFVTYKGYDFESILKKISQIENNNAIVLLAFYIVDLDGTFYDTSVMTKKITENAAVPVYGLYEFSFGHGIVGGKLVSGYSQGKRVVEIMYEYFSGLHGDSYIEGSETNLNMYDYHLLEQLDYPINLLPEDSIIINQPITFLQRHYQVVIGSLIVVVILLLYILILRRQVKLHTLKFLTINQKLYDADKLTSLGQMMHRISHELNTPIGNSITTSTYIEKNTNHILSQFNQSTLSKSSLKEYLVNTNESTSLLTSSLNTANELMTAFRIFSEHTEDDRLTKFDLSYYLDNLIITYQAALKPKGHQIQLHTEANLIIYGKTQDYYKIFNHLIDNAIIHGFNNLIDKTIKIDVSLTNNNLTIAFSDNGIGMTSVQLNNIFIQKYRYKKSSHSVLGLVQIKELIEDLNGKISCESLLNQGTRYLINIPLNKG